MYLYNNPTLKERRRELRKSQTDAERILWSQLRNRQLSGLKFFRQYSVGPYILDFFTPEARLAIELDGGHHDEKEIKQYDSERTMYLQDQAIRVVRFWNNDVLQNLNGVLEAILAETSK